MNFVAAALIPFFISGTWYNGIALVHVALLCSYWQKPIGCVAFQPGHRALTTALGHAILYAFL